MAERWLTKPGFWEHFVSFSRKNSKTQSSLNLLQSGPRESSKSDFSGLAPIRRFLTYCRFRRESWDATNVGSHATTSEGSYKKNGGRVVRGYMRHRRPGSFPPHGSIWHRNRVRSGHRCRINVESKSNRCQIDP